MQYNTPNPMFSHLTFYLDHLGGEASAAAAAGKDLTGPIYNP